MVDIQGMLGWVTQSPFEPIESIIYFALILLIRSHQVTKAYGMRSNMRNSLDVPRTLNQTGDLAFSDF